MNILLFGGGLDSTALMIEMVYQGIDFTLVHIDYGQVAAKAERAAMIKLGGKYSLNGEFVYVPQIRAANHALLERSDTPVTKQMAELPGRNLYLINSVIFLSGLDIDKIYIGFMGGTFRDSNKEFFDTTNLLLEKTFEKKIELVAPFLGGNRFEMCKQAYERDGEFFLDTVSCWTPTVEKGLPVECGTCYHCERKRELAKSIMRVEV